MRILHFYKTALPDTIGGVEQVIDQIIKGTQRLGIDAEVLSLTTGLSPRTTEINGYKSHYARRDFQLASTGFSVSVIRRFAQLVKGVDVVHYHFPWPFMDVVHFATQIKNPAIVTYHSDIIRQKCLLRLYHPLKNQFLKSMDRIVATSPNYLKSSATLNRLQDKVSVIPIGLDKATYPQPTQSCLQDWRERIGSKFFLFIGALRYYKGLHILLETAQGMDCPIVIVGAGPVESELKIQVAARGLRNIHFMGFLPDESKVALLMLCYAVVFPSHLRSEAFGVALLEGAMYGKPLISSEIGTGTTFINIEGETGMVVPPNDPVALREAMRYLWDHPDHAAEMGRRAEERYWKYFTSDQMSSEYVRLYRELADT